MKSEAIELRYEGIEPRIRKGQKWKPDQQALIRAVAHDIRSTLASMSIGAETLAAMPGPPPQKVRQTAQVVVEQAQHISRLLDDMVAVVSDRVEDDYTNVVEVNEVIWEAAQQLWKMSRQRAVKLDILPSPDSVVVRGKRSYLIQAVRGCLEYGLVNLPERSEINISVKARPRPSGAGAVEVIVEYVSAVQDPELPRNSYAPAWEQVTMLAVRRIIGAHKGDVAVLGDGHDGVRVLLPQYQAMGVKQMPRPAPVPGSSLDDAASAVA